MAKLSGFCYVGLKMVLVAEAHSVEEVAQELLDRSEARSCLLPFCTYTMPDYLPAAHLELLAEKLEAVERGEIKRLMVFEPPRHGKSELISIRFPNWYLGRHPTDKIVQSSYAESLALSHSRAARDVCAGMEFGLLFPEVHHRPERRGQEQIPTPMQQAHEWGTEQGGSYYAVGLGGGLTGRGFNIGIIDDPIKDAEEAESLTYREKAWGWYQRVFRTRAEPDAAIILVMTRWHEDDIAGRLLALAKEDPTADQWEVLHLPAIDEEGRALWPDRFPLDVLLTIKASIGSYAFGALYQGRPSPIKGNILLREWWRWYDEPPAMMDEVIQTWDLTFKETGSSMVVGQVWGKFGADKYLLDQVRAKMSFPQTLEAIRTLSRYWPQAVAKLVEDKANGPAVIATLQNEIPGIIAVEPRGGKTVRARAVSPEVEAGNVYLPRNESWTKDFVEEAANFPHGLFDDQVDAFSQALTWWQKREGTGEDIVEFYDPVNISSI